MKKKLIGILGGMGPLATMHFFKLIIEKTPAKRDQEHIPLLILNNPEIPDRTSAILYGKESPLKDLISSAKLLENCGAKAIFIPCITAHYFINEIKKSVSIKVFDLIETSIKHIKEKFPYSKRIGIIATDGTIKTGIIENYFKNEKLLAIYPDSEYQNLAMETIYSIKAGKTSGISFQPVVKNLKEKGAEVIFAGCTEVSIFLSGENIVNPLEISAEECIKFSSDFN